MKTEKFLEKLSGALGTEEPLEMSFLLEDVLEWDSLGLVSFLAMADAYFGKKLNIEQIKDVITVSDLYYLIED